MSDETDKKECCCAVVIGIFVLLLVTFIGVCANICTVIKEETSRYNVIILLIVCLTIIAVCCAVIFIAKSVTHLKQKKLEMLKEAYQSKGSSQYEVDIYKAFSTSVSEV